MLLCFWLAARKDITAEGCGKIATQLIEIRTKKRGVVQKNVWPFTMYPNCSTFFNLTITSTVLQTPCLLLGGMLPHDRLLSLWSNIQISLSSISCLSHVALLYQQKGTDMQDMQVALSVSVMSKAFDNATTTLGKGFTNHLNFRSYQSLCFE